ncbi:uncharacterized protein LOC127863294 [Dreissena polymorpha]|uniref:Uncharacterized protein n=1 Tax=Dreissena polymorpha TaxID=45954 RepID=A0A9D3Y6A2_DREPO|nr:uncharacterized protein LOC127863294 [Dreissena polymorpha]KAH3692744.1 hypothetical protein DPMN_193898 [Dreissena polymorpha]
MTPYNYKTHPETSLSQGSKYHKAPWKLMKASVYYGTHTLIGTIEAKAVLCRLCRDFVRNIEANAFWMLFGGLIVLFSLFNILLAASVRRLFSTRNGVVSAKENLWYCGNCVAKVTRSGAVYGYM